MMLLLQTAPLSMPNSWPEGAMSVERGVMAVGYDFSSASLLVMRVRQVVFASAPAFCKLGLCPGQDGTRKRECRRASCHDEDRPNSHRCSSPGITAKTPPSIYYTRYRHPTQVLTMGTSSVACASVTCFLGATG